MTDDAPRPAEQAEPAQAQFAQADLEWGEDGAPRSRRFGDVYYSLADGLAESRAVYLHGCGLPEAWRGRTRFVAGELGFGSGLNIVALLDLWARERPPGGRLQVFSVEAFPMSAAEAARALDAWPELAATARLLLDRWPGRARGFHRVDLPELDAVLDVAVMDAAEALARQRSGEVCLAVGLHGGYGSAQRMYVKRGYVPDGSGAWYRDAPCAPYAPCANDDDLVLYMKKAL